MIVGNRPQASLVDAAWSGGGRRVFLSHTSELRAHPASPRSFIAAAQDAVQRAGHVAVDMAFFTSDERPSAQKCRDAVAGCDVYVVVAGFRYGSPVRDEQHLSYTELEYEAATAAGLPCLAFLLGEDAEGPRALFVDETHAPRQQAFRQRLQDAGTTAAFTRPDQLETLVYQALKELAERQAAQAFTESSPVQGSTAASPAASAAGPGAVGGAAWNIPARTVDAIGRDDLLSDLGVALRESGRVAAHAALHGIGGIGKTTAAVEYAHRHTGDYDIAWWVPAQDPTLIPDALSGLAQALNLAAVTDPADTAIARLFGVLASRDRWLMVFDNADHPAAIAQFLPPGQGHVLITSRNPHWSGTATPVPVTVFDRPDSVALLQGRRPDLTQAQADRIADELGDLPQVVHQAASLLADTMLTAEEYLRLLAEQRDDVLARGTPSGTTASAAASWAVSFNRLRGDDPVGLQLLTLLAWLGTEPLPRRLLTALLATDAELPHPLRELAEQPLDVADCIATLTNLGVITATPDAVQLHRVPAGLLRDRTKAESPSWQAIVVRALRQTVPPDPWNNPGVWPTWSALLPHVLAVTTPERLGQPEPASQ